MSCAPDDVVVALVAFASFGTFWAGVSSMCFPDTQTPAYYSDQFATLFAASE
jgi:succinate-acetate transporter protein